jgi:hypothetical protein
MSRIRHLGSATSTGLPMDDSRFFAIEIFHLTAKSTMPIIEGMVARREFLDRLLSPLADCFTPDVRERADGLTRLFDPRVELWNSHFRREGALIIGVTDIGRATVAVMNMNAMSRQQLRERSE